MARHLKIMICLLSGLALLPAAAGCAQAAGNVTAPGVLLQQNELQMMQNRLQRQQYQQNQQIIPATPAGSGHQARLPGAGLRQHLHRNQLPLTATFSAGTFPPFI